MFEFLKEKFYDWSQPSAFQVKKEDKEKSIFSSDDYVFESMYGKRTKFEDMDNLHDFMAEVGRAKSMINAIGIGVAKAKYYYFRLDEYEKDCLRDYMTVKSNFEKSLKEMMKAYKLRKLKKKKIKAVLKDISDLDYVISKSRFLGTRMDDASVRSIYENFGIRF